MLMTRRNFAVRGGSLLGLLATVQLTTACPAWLGNLYQNILKYVPTALQAFGAIVAILTGAGVPIAGVLSAAIDMVKATLADLQTAVKNYVDAPAAAKATLLGRVSTALQDAEATIQLFWADLHIPDAKLASTIQGLLGLIVAALMGFQGQLPAPAPTAVSARRAQLGTRVLIASPRKMSAAEFKREFNDLLVAGGFGGEAIN